MTAADRPVSWAHRRAFLKLCASAGASALLGACGAADRAAAPAPLPTASGSVSPTSGGLAATDAPQPAGATPTAGTTGAPTPAPFSPPEGGPLRTPALAFGVVAQLFYTDRSRALALAGHGGFGWVRQQIHWRDIEGARGVYNWGELDHIVNDASASGIELLVNIVRAPGFYNANGGIPRAPAPMGDLVAAMADRYGEKIRAYEIWNEPNLAFENGGRITEEDPGRYVEVLAECYRRIKSVNARLIVLAAAPSSTGVNDPAVALSDERFLRLMYEYRGGIAREFFDAQAAHPGAAANDPDWLYPELPGDRPGWNDHPTHYFRHVENVRRVMLEYDLGDRQIWLTEYGWATANDTPGYEYGNLISPETQADYITRAVTRASEQYRDERGQWVGAMFLWNLNFAVHWGAQGNPRHEQVSFGMLNPDWSPRPAFLALQGLHARLRQDQGE